MYFQNLYKGIRMKKILITIGLFVVLFFILHYYWFSEMEQRFYVQTKYEKLSDTVSLYQFWTANGFSFHFTLPYKELVYDSPYTYSINLAINNTATKTIIFNELKLLLPSEQIDLLNDENIILDNINQEGGDVFRETKKLEITCDNYQLRFRNIEIPFEKTSGFYIKISLTLQDKSGISVQKTILSEFKRKIVRERVFPTA
jgi:hypothetical protein